ncbi:MAG: sigma-70 family RNA polymerase sigma factor [Planctomycetes bacterium]|jgi:RNA polymerase sigma-70 factor (ECF subfamily)|nr:sigma-70 family RNA polymerase sigma factor [Phycisphaerae bacterium]NBB96104.1 sigma-70 family RNA polymerase sigma factor [Planctomycetota bacterium]
MSKDKDIIARCLDGEAAAFDELYATHAGRVKGFLLRSGFDPADADDQTQEVFLRVYKSLKTYDPQRGGFRPWLGAVVRNVARRYWSKRKQPESFDPQLAMQMFEAPDGQSASQREELNALRQAISKLDGERAQLLRLRYVEGLTTRAIAKRINMPESTVRLRLGEARSQLAVAMRSMGFLN